MASVSLVLALLLCSTTQITPTWAARHNKVTHEVVEQTQTDAGALPSQAGAAAVNMETPEGIKDPLYRVSPRLGFSMPRPLQMSLGEPWPKPNVVKQHPEAPRFSIAPKRLPRPAMPWPYQWFPRQTPQPMVDTKVGTEEDQPTFDEPPLFTPADMKEQLIELNLQFWQDVLFDMPQTLVVGEQDSAEGDEKAANVVNMALSALKKVEGTEKDLLDAAYNAVKQVQALQKQLNEARKEREDWIGLRDVQKTRVQQERRIEKHIAQEPEVAQGYLVKYLLDAKQTMSKDDWTELLIAHKLKKDMKTFFKPDEKELQKLEAEVANQSTVVKKAENKVQVAVEQAEVVLRRANLLAPKRKADATSDNNASFPLGPAEQLAAAQTAVKEVHLLHDELEFAKADVNRQNVFLAVAQEEALRLFVEAAKKTQDLTKLNMKELDSARERVTKFEKEVARASRKIEEVNAQMDVAVEDAEVQLARANLLFFGTSNWWEHHV